MNSPLATSASTLKFSIHHPMRSQLAIFLATPVTVLMLTLTAHAQSRVPDVTIKMTVTSRDQDAIHTVARQLTEQNYAIALAVTTTQTDLSAAQETDPHAIVSVSTMSTGTFTKTQIEAAQAQCRHYATLNGVSCTTEIKTTYGKLD